MQLNMTLKKAAQKAGGDRYEATMSNGEQLVIYFPQNISRPNNGKPLQGLSITITPN